MTLLHTYRRILQCKTLAYNDRISNFNLCYSIKIKSTWLKIGKVLVTRYVLIKLPEFFAYAEVEEVLLHAPIT